MMEIYFSIIIIIELLVGGGIILYYAGKGYGREIMFNDERKFEHLEDILNDSSNNLFLQQLERELYGV